MTGPEAYREAVRLLSRVDEYTSVPAVAQIFTQSAQAYATLALAAATAEAIAQKYNGRSPKADNAIAREWTEAIS